MLNDDGGSEWDRGSTSPRLIFEALNRHGVDYTVIGGVAVIAHGHPRNTRDVDLVASVEPDNLERLAAALKALDAELWGVDAHLLGIDLDAKTLGEGGNFTLRTRAGGLDFFYEVPGGIDYQDLKQRSVVVEVQGEEIRIAGFDDLIRMKKAAGRTRDLEDIAVLTDPSRDQSE